MASPNQFPAQSRSPSNPSASSHLGQFSASSDSIHRTSEGHHSLPASTSDSFGYGRASGTSNGASRMSGASSSSFSSSSRTDRRFADSTSDPVAPPLKSPDLHGFVTSPSSVSGPSTPRSAHSPSGSSERPSSAGSGTSRNFLVPIGGTGARKKLSIVNAGAQRRRPPTADSVMRKVGEGSFGGSAASLGRASLPSGSTGWEAASEAGSETASLNSITGAASGKTYIPPPASGSRYSRAKLDSAGSSWSSGGTGDAGSAKRDSTRTPVSSSTPHTGGSSTDPAYPGSADSRSSASYGPYNSTTGTSYRPSTGGSSRRSNDSNLSASFKGHSDGVTPTYERSNPLSSSSISGDALPSSTSSQFAWRSSEYGSPPPLDMPPHRGARRPSATSQTSSSVSQATSSPPRTIPYSDPLHQDSRFPPQGAAQDRIGSLGSIPAQGASLEADKARAKGARQSKGDGTKGKKSGFRTLFSPVAGKREIAGVPATTTSKRSASISAGAGNAGPYSSSSSLNAGEGTNTALGSPSRDTAFAESLAAGYQPAPGEAPGIFLGSSSDLAFAESLAAGYRPAPGERPGSIRAGSSVGSSLHGSKSALNGDNEDDYRPYPYREDRRPSAYTLASSGTYSSRSGAGGSDGEDEPEFNESRRPSLVPDTPPVLDFDFPSPGFFMDSSPLDSQPTEVSKTAAKDPAAHIGAGGESSMPGQSTADSVTSSSFDRTSRSTTSLNSTPASSSHLLPVSASNDQLSSNLTSDKRDARSDLGDLSDVYSEDRLAHPRTASLAATGLGVNREDASRLPVDKSLPPTPNTEEGPITPTPSSYEAGSYAMHKSQDQKPTNLRSNSTGRPEVSPTRGGDRFSVGSVDASSDGQRSSVASGMSGFKSGRRDDRQSYSSDSGVSPSTPPNGPNFAVQGASPDSAAALLARPSLPAKSKARPTPTPPPTLPGDSDVNISGRSSAASSHAAPTTPTKPLPRRLEPDPATLARLENGTPIPPMPDSPLPISPDDADEKKASNREKLALAGAGGAIVVAAAGEDTKKETEREKRIREALASLPTGADPKTYIPPGALTRTRNGLGTPGSTASPSLRSTSADRTSDKSPNRPPPESGLHASRSSPYPLGTEEPSASRFSMTNTEASLTPSRELWDDSTQDRRTISLDREREKGEEAEDLDSEADDDDIGLNGQMLPSSAWLEVDAALRRFNDALPGADKGALLRSVLLPFLALEAETPNLTVIGTGVFQSPKNRRALFFEWVRHLLLELQHVQTSADRGAILESIACIIESRNFAADVLNEDQDDRKRFASVFGHILSYAIGELNKKGVYQNTLIFSGRLLAVAFFRVDGVASKLLRALPVNRFALERVAAEANWDAQQPDDFQTYRSRFPAFLQLYCFADARSYLQMLDAQTVGNPDRSPNGEDVDEDRYLVRQPEVEVEMTGNWLRRWQSDDSELFFSFCRSYHRQLAGLFQSERNLRRASYLFFGAPGYAHLATCIHQKCLSLVHRDILSVTTLSSQKNFNPGETANVLSGSTAGKPRHLEAANRRCTAIVVDVIRASSTPPGTVGPPSLPAAPAITGPGPLFGPMLGVHVKCLVKRTSLYDVQGVFCLLDWLDGVLAHMENAELGVEDLLDVGFVIDSIELLLENADHALALMRAIAFCYSNFAILISTHENRVRFCERILLKPSIFQKLFLSWSFTIRAYFLHLLVFRLARISDFAVPKDDTEGQTSVSVVRLFNQRLDEIRKRHDELSPPPTTASDEDNDDYSRFKRGRPGSFVSTIRHTPSLHRPDSAGNTTKAERVLGIGMPDPVLAPKGEQKVQSRAAKWLRALGGGKGKKSINGGSHRGGSGAAGSPYTTLDNPKILNEPRRKMVPLDELDFDDSDPSDDEADSGGTQSVGGTLTPSESDSSALSGAAGGDYPPVDLAPDSAHGDNIALDTSFDLQSPTSAFHPPGPGTTTSGNGASAAAAAARAVSPPRISRAFSKRHSLLPGPAYDLVEADEVPAVTAPENLYEKSLHIYAVQSLREYEQTVQEHDEFFASQANPDLPAVPRLGVHWPAMWTDG